MPFVQITCVFFPETYKEQLNTTFGENTQLFIFTAGGLCTKQKMNVSRKK
jgi:hypothetical protein